MDNEIINKIFNKEVKRIVWDYTLNTIMVDDETFDREEVLNLASTNLEIPINNLKYCNDCNILIINGDDTHPNICDECFSFYSECTNCGEMVHEYDMTTDDFGNHICPECIEFYETCEDCGFLINRRHNNFYTTSDNRIICEECYQNSYFTCDECGEIYSTDECYEDDCNYYCEYCFHERRTNVIYDYHGFRDWHDLGNDSNLRFGFELEVENTKNLLNNKIVASEVCSIMNKDVICSYDGSLDDGFEIVSHPMTLKYINDNTDKLKNMLSYLRKNGFESHNPGTCGLHIHVSRDGLGTTSTEQNRVINNILMLFENFTEEITIFSRRRSGDIKRWANFISSYRGFNGKILSMKYIVNQKNHCNRYMAVNLENRDTIEFRIFRGTLNFGAFISVFYFIDSIITLAKEKSINGVTWNKIIKNNEVLQAYSNKRGIISKVKANEIIIKYKDKKPKLTKILQQEQVIENVPDETITVASTSGIITPVGTSIDFGDYIVNENEEENTREEEI